jgi:N,N'-diacetyllegionaminate synthase
MIIAEIGMNHLGSLSMAKEYIDILSRSKVDAITFQIREKSYYNGEKKKYSLNDQDYATIAKLIKSKNKKFGVAIADENKIDFLDSIGVDFYKVIRNDITNDSLISKLLSTGKKIIVSTGLSSDEDIEDFVKKNKNNKSRLVLNHTQLSYEAHDCNLSAIRKMKEKYNFQVSFGNHCANKNVLYMSLCYNPSDVLFYVKMNNHQTYPDSKHSVLAEDVSEVAKNIAELSSAVGSGNKIPMVNKMEEK